MSLTSLTERNFRREAAKLFKLDGREFGKWSRKATKDVSVEEVIQQLGYDGIIPLSDFRQEFKAVLDCYFIASLAYHNGDGRPDRAIEEHVGISHMAVYTRRHLFEHIRPAPPLKLILDQFKEILLKDEPARRKKELGRVYAPLIMGLFPMYMQVINSEISLHDMEAKLKELYEPLDKAYIEHAINDSQQNKSAIAEILGITRQTMHRLMKKYKIETRMSTI